MFPMKIRMLEGSEFLIKKGARDLYFQKQRNIAWRLAQEEQDTHLDTHHGSAFILHGGEKKHWTFMFKRILEFILLSENTNWDGGKVIRIKHSRRIITTELSEERVHTEGFSILIGWKVLINFLEQQL